MPSVAPRERVPFSADGADDGCVEQLLLHEKVIGVDHIYHGGLRFVKELALLALPRNPGPGTRVLNLGCGFGGFAFQVASANPHVSVVACDPNDAVVEEAELRLCEAHPELVDRVRFSSRDLDDLEFPPGSFDAVVCIELNSFVSGDKSDLVGRKFKRWLKPGGKLVVVDYCWSSRMQRRMDMASGAGGANVTASSGGGVNLARAADAGGGLDFNVQMSSSSLSLASSSSSSSSSSSWSYSRSSSVSSSSSCNDCASAPSTPSPSFSHSSSAFSSVIPSPILDKDAYACCLRASYPILWVDDRTLAQLDLIQRDLRRLDSFSPGSKREDSMKRECSAQWRNLCGLLSDDSLSWILFCATNSASI